MKREKIGFVFHWMDLIKSIGMIIGATCVGNIFWEVGLSEANITMVYILAVLIISVITTHQIYSMIFSLVSVVVFNYFFTLPRYTLHAYDKDYPITFVIMFLAFFGGFDAYILTVLVFSSFNRNPYRVSELALGIP